jgi:hypothetical protein
MVSTAPFMTEGPYLLVLIRDTETPDWDAFAQDILDESGGARRVALAIGKESGVSPRDPGLQELVDRLRDRGVDAAIVA